MAVADDADGEVRRVQPQVQYGTPHILGHAGGVAPRGVAGHDAVRRTPGQVELVHADGGCGDELRARALEQGLVALGAGADEKGVGVLDAFGGEVVGVDILYVGNPLKTSTQEGDELIGDNFDHLAMS